MKKFEPAPLPTIKPLEYPMSQYRQPLNYELVGKSFTLIMDSGYDYELTFDTRETVSYGKVGEDKNTYPYECLKGDPTTYFVNIPIKNEVPGRIGLSVILDLEQSLVTTVTAVDNFNPKCPRLMKTENDFGAILREDGTAPEVRHGYTDEMVGRAIRWRYGTTDVIHIYASEHYYRLATAADVIARMDPDSAPARNRRSFADRGIVYEEPSDYIKIKDGLYVFSMTEYHMCISRPSGGSNLLFLMDLNRLIDVGRAFGWSRDNNPENYTYSAFGQYVDATPYLEKDSTYYIR